MPHASLEDIAQLSVAERIQLAEDIWDTVAAAPDALRLTPAQEQELDSRLDDCAQNPQAGASWEEVRQRVQGQS